MKKCKSYFIISSLKYLAMWNKLFIIFLAAGLFAAGCKKDSVEKSGVFVSTSDAANITSLSATVGGDVDVVGTNAISERGVCWNTDSTSKPTTENNKAVATGNNTGHFNADITGLTSGTNYYARAYVINNGKTY